MRYETWTDEHGYDHRSMLPDWDKESHPSEGIPADPPDLSEIDWADVQKRLHNQMVGRSIFTWDDLRRNGGDLKNAILTAIVPLVTERFK